MARYYFDLHDDGELVVDEEGIEFRNLHAVQEEAARALAALALDTVQNFKGARSQHMSVEVRDDCRPVMRVRFMFEIDRK